MIDIELNKDPNKGGLGFSIAGGVGNQHVVGDNGIFVTKILPGLAADMEGSLSVGDRIMEVDSQTMENITHEAAVSVLKSTGQKVVLKIEKNAARLSPSSSMEQLLDMVCCRRGDTCQCRMYVRGVVGVARYHVRQCILCELSCDGALLGDNQPRSS